MTRPLDVGEYTMRKRQLHRRMALVGAILVLVLTAIVKYGSGGAVRSTEAELAKKAETKQSTTATDLARRVIRRTPEMWPAELQRDFFRASWAVPAPASQPADTSAHQDQIRRRARTLDVEAILGGERPRAVINGTVTTVGDTVNDFQVSRITGRSVILTSEGFEVTLHP